MMIWLCIAMIEIIILLLLSIRTINVAILDVKIAAKGLADEKPGSCGHWAEMFDAADALWDFRLWMLWTARGWERWLKLKEEKMLNHFDLSGGIRSALSWVETAQETLCPDRDIPCDDQAWHQLERAREILIDLCGGVR